MTLGSFVLKNALRNKRRATLTVLSVAISMFLLVTLLVTVRELTQPPEGEGAALRVIVRNKISLANTLPARQRPLIEKIPGVEAVSAFSWFGGKYKDEDAMSFAQLAVDPVPFGKVFVEATISPGGAEKFINERRSCLVGKITADKYNIKTGDRMTLIGTMYPCDLELTVAGIYEGSVDDRNVFFQEKYLDEAIGDPGTVGTWWVKVRKPSDMPGVITAINKTFENTSSEVRAESERAFQLSFISMLGNIKLLVNSICSVVVFTLLLVSASTMSMAIRERFRELAVLKALGFRRRELFAFILAESFGLSLFGAILGIGTAYFLFTFGNVNKMTGGFLVVLEVTPKIIGTGLLVASLLGIIASIAPSIAVARMSVVGGLKTLD